MTHKLTLLAFFMALAIATNSCEYHDTNDFTTSVTTDADLFTEIGEDGHRYYRNGNLFSAASASPHGSFKLRFNAIAWASLDASGELPPGARFPEGSVIVKEVYSGNDINVYAVMKKAPSDAYAGDGWVWSEYSKDGSVAFSVTNKGNGCVSCHSESHNRDRVRTFDLH
jgi:hypothetical protein